MATWTRQAQECDGSYFFNGRCVMTQGVGATLMPEEIMLILADLHAFVEEQDGIDYLIVYECSDGRKVWIIDQLNQEMKDSGDYTPEELVKYDVYTLLLPSEY